VKLRPALVALVGAGVMVWLVARAGLGPVIRAVSSLGLGGFGLIVAFQFGLAALAGGAWALLVRGSARLRVRDAVWARLVRDAAGQALPFTQIGGIALGARALALEGVAGEVVVASTIADTALEFLSELAYAALGASLLQALRPAQPFGRPVLAMLAALAAMAALFFYAQSAGAPQVERLVRRLSSRGAEGLPVAEALAALRRRPAAAATAGLIHFAAWLLTGVQTWLMLRLLHARVGLAGALLVDSLTSGARAAAFLVPGGLGVQEGVLVLLGQLFGVAAPTALALSLLRRGRDLALGLPVLAIWQLRHGERIWRFGHAARDA
jgi:putative membrane protein